MDTLEVDPGGAQADGTCALTGCDLPLPPRSLDEQGRRRAGRRPLYCSKAHADQASRQRRSADVAAVAEPLSQAQALGQSVLPVARELMALVGDLIGRFDGAEAAALARVTVAEAEAAEAREDATEARKEAHLAEQGRRQALAEVREAVKARDGALREAATSRREAEQMRAEAWGQVAAHERVRGQAEAARQAAEAAAERLAVELRQASEVLERERAVAAESATRLTAVLQQVELSRTAHRTAVASAALLESARAEAAAERDRLLAEAEQMRAELAEARAEAVTWRAEARDGRACASQAELDGARVREQLSRTVERGQQFAEELVSERAQRHLAEQRLADSREATAAGERRLADLQTLLMTLGDSPA
jgi:hypothetical protein